MSSIWIFGAAFAAELALGWPRRLPHPVQAVGRWLDWLEPRLRAVARTRGEAIGAGAFGVALTLALWGTVAAALLRFPHAGALAAFFLMFAGLALGSLLRAGREALNALTALAAQGTETALENARRQVGGMVSRDLSQAGEADLFRALAESLAENFNDAVIAPLFWLALGGPVGLWLYKAASTMDSMWGYRTPRWEYLGKAAARLDDVLAFVPARLAAALLWIAAPGSGRAFWPGVAVVRAQARSMASPNGGWPMAAAAWLHAAPMGGPTVYHGEVVDKPRLGPAPGASAADAPSARWTVFSVDALLRHITRAGLLAGALTALAALAG